MAKKVVDRKATREKLSKLPYGHPRTEEEWNEKSQLAAEAAGFDSPEAQVADSELRAGLAEQEAKRTGSHGGPRANSGRPRKDEVQQEGTARVFILNTFEASARLIAMDRGISVTEYLNSILKDPISRDIKNLKF